MPKQLEILFKHPLFPPTHPTPLHPTPNTNPPDISSRDTKINTWAHADIEKFHIYKQSCTVLLYKRHWPLLTRKFDKRPWIENGERIAIQSSST